MRPSVSSPVIASTMAARATVSRRLGAPAASCSIRIVRWRSPQPAQCAATWQSRWLRSPAPTRRNFPIPSRRHEPAAINGVGHLLQHMAFKGTERASALAIAEEIEAVGGHLNAYTSREHTAYYAKVLKEDAPLAVDILADILQHSVFDPEELDRERTVILQEIGQAIDTPDDIIFDLFQERAYPDQAMGRPVLGRADIIGRIGRDTVAAYLHENYAAPRMVLAAAGNIDHDSLVAHAERVFAALPRVSAARTEPAIYVGGELREQRDLEQVHVALGFNGLAYTDPDHYAASVLSTALGGGMSSRLFQEIREKRGLVYTIYSFAHGYRDSGVFGVYAGTGPD